MTGTEIKHALTPTHRLVRIALWIFGGGTFATLLLLSSYMGLTLSDTGWKSITSISLAIIAAGVPLIVSHMKSHNEKLDRVEEHTNSLVQKLVADAKEEGEDIGRRKEVQRAEREDKEVAKDDDSLTETAQEVIEEIEGTEVTLEGTLTTKEEDKQQ